MCADRQAHAEEEDEKRREASQEKAAAKGMAPAEPAKPEAAKK